MSSVSMSGRTEININMLLDMCPHMILILPHVSSYQYICILILDHICPHNTPLVEQKQEQKVPLLLLLARTTTTTLCNSSKAGMMEGNLSLSGPLSSIFPNMFQMNGNGKENGSGSGVTPPHSTDRCVRP